MIELIAGLNYAAILSRCYTQRALRPYIDLGINYIRHFIKVQFVNKGIEIINFPSIYEPVHDISNNVVCATSKASDQPALMRSLIRVFANRLHTL